LLSEKRGIRLSTMTKKPKSPPPDEELDLDPNAWEKFEALLKSAAKKRPPAKKPKSASSKKRAPSA
jgi:hypothetical protein